MNLEGIAARLFFWYWVQQLLLPASCWETIQNWNIRLWVKRQQWKTKTAESILNFSEQNPGVSPKESRKVDKNLENELNKTSICVPLTFVYLLLSDQNTLRLSVGRIAEFCHLGLSRAFAAVNTRGHHKSQVKLCNREVQVCAVMLLIPALLACAGHQVLNRNKILCP